MNNRIVRDIPAAARAAHYDVIVIGGGIFGSMLLLESAARGLNALLIEQNDFGSATSFNSLRIVHGGLRYLQSLDLPRFFESVGERRWFLREFPDLVHPLGCMMPLYGEGLRRRSILRVALALNDVLSSHRNVDLPPDRQLRPGRTIDAKQALSFFPNVRRDGLNAAAIWYDACVPDSQRLIMEVLRRSTGIGATALNYLCAEDLLSEGGQVRGVRAVDVETAEKYEFRADVVINAAGPWCRQIAGRFDKDEETLFRSCIAWNILFDRDALSDYAVAIAPPRDDAQIYFASPWKNRLLVGTGYAPWTGAPEQAMPSDEQLRQFIDEINAAVPGLGLGESSIVRVFAGLLPARNTACTKLAVRDMFLDHSAEGGPSGFYSISGVKFTTARLVAEKTLRKIFPEQLKSQGSGSPQYQESDIGTDDSIGRAEHALMAGNSAELSNVLAKFINDESVVHLDDLVLRRTTLWERPDIVLKSMDTLLGLFDWDESRQRQEVARLKAALDPVSRTPQN